MKRLSVALLFFVLAITSFFMISKVKINYDLKQYLPSSSQSSAGLDLLSENFGDFSTINLMLDVSDFSPSQMLAFSADVEDMGASVTFLEDVLTQDVFNMIKALSDPTTLAMLQTLENAMPYSYATYPEMILSLYMNYPTQMSSLSTLIDPFYNTTTQMALYTIKVPFDASSQQAKDLYQMIRDKVDADGDIAYFTGSLVSNIYTSETVTSEVFNITIVIIPIILVILLMMTPSIFDLLLFLITAGVAIVLNLGTNVFLPSISFITQSMAIALQLAISLDYIIFIVSRYHEERSNFDKEEALQKSFKKIKSPVIASAMTTLFSFIALLFMRFTIGFDIGIVFAKAIFFSMLSSLILLPILIRWFDPLLQKGKHGVLIPHFSKFAKMIYKGRYVFLAFLALVFVPAFYFQNHNNFIYGDSALTESKDSQYSTDEAAITDSFGRINSLVILTEEDMAKEASLVFELQASDLPITSVSAYTIASQSTSDVTLLAMYHESFCQNGYCLVSINIDLPPESEATTAAVKELQTILDNTTFESHYLLGSSAITADMEEIIKTDYLIVTAIALLLIMLIIFVTFKNLVIPLILPFLIETAVFFSMAIPYFFGTRVVFLAYLIVSTILLGATIDYAILLSKRYIELREAHDKPTSIDMAITESAPSIFTSALIFGISGLSISFISKILTISQIGLQIALGAFTSMIFVLILLPQLLFIFDAWFMKGHLTKRVKKQEK